MTGIGIGVAIPSVALVNFIPVGGISLRRWNLRGLFSVLARRAAVSGTKLASSDLMAGAGWRVMCVAARFMPRAAGDLDSDQGMLTVRDAKFGRTRLVPLNPSAAGALTRYGSLRDEHHPRPAAPALFLSTAGTRLLHSNVSLTFSKLTAQAGLARRSAACRPRIHDVRH